MLSLVLFLTTAVLQPVPAITAFSMQPTAVFNSISFLQEDAELERLSKHQRLAAEQARRLGRVLERLQLRAEKSGETERAARFQEARERLAQGDNKSGIAETLDGIANDLAALRPGVAAEQQAIVLEELRALLNELLAEERNEQSEKAIAQAMEKVQRMMELLEKQKAITEQTQKLSEQDPETLSSKELTELIKQQQEIADQLQTEEGKQKQEALEDAKAATEELKNNDPKSALPHQEDLIEALEKAAQEAQQEADEMQQEAQAKALLDAARACADLLARHEKIRVSVLEATTQPLPETLNRKQLILLRESSEATLQISKDTKDLMFQIADHGSALFPFLLKTLYQDHKKLSKLWGAPSYEYGDSSQGLSARLTERWEHIIDAFLTEAERKRPKMNAPEGQQHPKDEKKKRALVDFAVELQLLKRMQQDLLLELQESDESEREALLERQKELRTHFEDMIEKLRGETPTEDQA